MTDQQHTRFLLGEDDIPTHWVNLLPDLPGDPLPPLNPLTKEPAGPPDLTPIFPMALIEQEVSAEPDIEIPEEVRDAYALWRPTPLYRARRLEKALDTPAHIYYKYEGTSPAGSHKVNTAIPQAYENARAGITRLSTETGAGQWGSALSFACTLFDLECEVFMVGSSYDQKPYRRSMMQLWGSSVVASPSQDTNFGRAVLAEDPENSGSLGMAISEAVIPSERQKSNEERDIGGAYFPYARCLSYVPRVSFASAGTPAHGYPAQTSRNVSSTTSCTWPFDAHTPRLLARVRPAEKSSFFPSRSVIRPPASSVINAPAAWSQMRSR